MAGFAGADASLVRLHRPLVRRSPDRPELGPVGGALRSQVGTKGGFDKESERRRSHDYRFDFSELFNLPLPALWTVVLGEYDRGRESGYEQRIPVDKIILHEKYHNFKHDLGM